MRGRRLQTVFNTKKFLQSHFNSASVVYNFLVAYSVSVRLEAIQKWWQREKIPSEWFALILALLELDRGEPVRLAQYLTSGD
jgi:hypothetical protein